MSGLHPSSSWGIAGLAAADDEVPDAVANKLPVWG
jgi:hypothetical protein